MNSREYLLRSVSLSFVAFCVVLSQAPRASAESAFSVNALAYADVNLSTGSNFITNPFSKPNNTVSNLFPSMPSGSYLRIYELATNGGRTWPGEEQILGPTNSFSASTGWSDPNVTIFLPQGALMWVPSPTQISFSGEVFQGGLTGRMYPAGTYVLGAIPRTGFVYCGNFTDCPPPEPPDSTIFCKWDRPQQRCVSYQYVSSPDPGSFPSGWYDQMFNRVDLQLEAGESGVFYVPSAFAVPGLAVPLGPPSPTPGAPLVHTRRDGTNLTFQFFATNGTFYGLAYSVERSTNLTENIWHTIRNGNVSNSPTTVTVTDTTNASAFYRVKSQSYSAAPYLFDDFRTNGQFSFRFYASTGTVFEVQRTIAINDPAWQTISSIAAGTNRFVSFTDSNAVAATGYYRVRFTF